jgi:hypothetical protein
MFGAAGDCVRRVRLIIHLMPDLDETRVQPFDLTRIGANWLSDFFEVSFILHVPVMYYIYILSLFNLILTAYILYYNFNTTKLVYMSKMAHEGIRTVKREGKGRDRQSKEKRSRWIHVEVSGRRKDGGCA